MQSPETRFTFTPNPHFPYFCEIGIGRDTLLRKIFHIILSCCLSILLLFGGTAKEFVHLFAPHEDTVHHTHKPGELSFENEHHHCSFLSFSLTPFIYQEFLKPVFTKKPFFSVWKEKLTENIPAQNSGFSKLLRGPPLKV